MRLQDQRLGARLRVVVAPGIGFGPGKISLLRGVNETGSISAAGRLFGMSYKRAWHLVEAMNGHFAEPLVETSKGGRAGGGAKLTPLGRKVLDAFDDMERLTNAAIEPAMRKLRRHLPADR